MPARAAAIALLTFSLMTGAAGAFAATLKGSGRSVTEDRAVAGYNGIALSLPARVEVVQGATEGIRITAGDNVLPEIESVVEGAILKLRRLAVSVAGSGDIRYYGDPLAERSVLGSGKVRRLGAAPS